MPGFKPELAIKRSQKTVKMGKSFFITDSILLRSHLHFPFEKLKKVGRLFKSRLVSNLFDGKIGIDEESFYLYYAYFLDKILGGFIDDELANII